MPIKIKNNQKRFILLALAAVVVIGMGGIFWQATKGASPKAATLSPALSSASPQPSPGSSSNDKAYAVTAGDGAGSSPTTGPGQLTTPTGQLLNLHSISLGSNPGMESACQTTPDVTCDIKLTQGGVTRMVGAKNTGSSGIVLFDWTAQELGLSTGQWTVQAVATQNAQSSTSASDYLTVNP